MRSYFCERKCRVRIDPKTTSEWHETSRDARYAMSIAKKSVSYGELLRWADLHTLRNRRLQEMATVMYKVKNNLSPSYIADLFKLNNSGYHLRNSDFIIRRFNSVS